MEIQKIQFSIFNRGKLKNFEKKASFGKQIELFKAHSGHKHFLLCNKTTSLHQINPESVFFAYQKYGIIMKDELRFLFKTS
jgi:hypothetical protein